MNEKNSNYFDYKKNQPDNNIPDSVKEELLFNFAEEVFCKDLNRKIYVCYASEKEQTITQKIFLNFKKMEWDINMGKSQITIYFENVEQYKKEISKKIMPLMTSLDLKPCFLVETYTGPNIVSARVVFADGILVLPETNAFQIKYTISVFTPIP